MTRKETKKFEESKVQPKKPISSYLAFSTEFSRKLRQERPDVKIVDCAKQASAEWQAMNSHQREKYQRVADTDKLR